MSKVVDQKVVEMRFDNGQFEKGVSQSMSSLDKLKASLNGFGGNFGTGLNSLSGNFGQFTSTIGEGSRAFSAFEEIGVGALRRIGEMAVNAGQSIVQNLVNNLKSGYNRYEEMMKSTQTIMYATRNEWEDQGEQMEYVNDQITKLQWYTDETSYNLSDMTSNVGKFIAAGIPLEDAVSNMMGIASWAAISGQNAEAASRAMYNLSQAMGQGALTMVDWRSIENANMATREFKQIAIETGLEFGKIWEGSDGLLYTFDQYGKEMEITVDNFRSTLSGKWLDSEVLSATLDKYGEFAVVLNEYVNATGMTTTEWIQMIDGAIEQGVNDLPDFGDEIQNFMRDYVTSLDVDPEMFDLVWEGVKTLSDEYYELGRAAFKAGQESKTLTDSLDYTKDALATAYNNIFQAIIGDYLESKEVWTQFSEMLYTWLVEPVEEFRDMLMEVKAYGGFDHLKNALLTIYDTVTTIKQTVSDTINGVLEKYHIGNKARSLLDILIKIDEFAQSISLQDWVWGSDIENITTAAETLGRVIAKLLMDLDTIKRSAKKAWETVFPKKDTLVGSFTDKLVEAADALEKWFDAFRMNPENADKITEIFENFLTVIKNVGDTISSIGKTIKDAWDMIFPKKEGPDADTIIDKVHGFSESLANLSEKFKMTDEKADMLKRTFAGVFAVVDIFKQLFLSIVNAFSKGDGEVTDFTEAILKVTSAIGDWIVGVRDWLAENDTFNEVVGAIADFIKNIPTYVNEASQALTGMDFGDAMKELWENIKNIGSGIKDFFSMFGSNKEEVEGASETISEVSGAVETVQETCEQAQPTIQKLLDMFKENTDTSGFKWPESLEEIGEAGKTGGVIAILAGVAAIIWKFVASMGGLDKNVKKIGKSISYMFTSVGDAAKALKKNIQAQTFKTIATAILEVAAAIFILALLDQDQMLIASGVIVAMFFMLAKTFETLQNVKTDEKKLAQIKKILGVLEVIIATLIGGIFLMATQAGMGEIVVAGAIIAILLVEIMGFLALIDQIKVDKRKVENVSKVIQQVCLLILAMGVSLMLATAVGNWKQIAAAGATMFLMLLAILAFIQEIDKVKVTKAQAANLAVVMDEICKVLLAMGAALLIATIGGADWKQIAAAGVAMGIMMLAVAAALKIMPNKKTVNEAAEAMAIASIAFVLMGAALLVATAGGADWKQLGAAGLVMSVMMIALAAAFRIMPDGATIIEKAAALLIASVGLVAIGLALRVLAGMKLEEIGVALLALAGGLAAVLIAGAVATYIGPGLMAIGIAMALIGASALMAGTGMWLFASALSMLFNLDASGIDTMIAALGAFFDEFPAFMTKVGEGILAFIQVFSDNSTAIYNMFVSMATLLVDAYRAIMPQVVAAVTETIIAVVQAYRTVTPLLIAAFTETIILLLESARTILPELMIFLTELFYEIDAFIRTTAPQMVDTVFYVLTLLLDGLNVWLRDNLPKLRELINFVIQEGCNSIRETSFIIGSTAVDTLIDALNIILERIGEITSIAVQIGIQVVLGVLDGFSEQIDDIIDAGAKFVISLINGIADGIDKYAKEIKDAMDHLATSLKNAFCLFLGIDPNSKSSKSSIFSGFGENIMQGLIDGINSLLDKAKETITNVATSVSDWFKDVLKIESPSKVFASFGKYIDQGLAKGLTKNVNLVEEATGEVSNATLKGMSDIISDISRLVEDGIDAEPTITPVLDLSNVREGFSTLDDLMLARRSTDMAIRNDDLMLTRISPEERINNMLSDLKASVDNNNRSPMTQTNTFNIDGAKDPKLIADEVSSIIQNQVDRRNAIWA